MVGRQQGRWRFPGRWRCGQGRDRRNLLHAGDVAEDVINELCTCGDIRGARLRDPRVSPSSSLRRCSKWLSNGVVFHTDAVSGQSSVSVTENCPENRPGKRRGHGIADLLLLKADRAVEGVPSPGKLDAQQLPVLTGRGLVSDGSTCSSDNFRSPPNEHLREGGDRCPYGTVIGPGSCAWSCRDILPIASLRHETVPLQHEWGVRRHQMVAAASTISPHPHP